MLKPRYFFLTFLYCLPTFAFASIFGFPEIKDSQGHLSFLIEADIQRYDNAQIYPIKETLSSKEENSLAEAIKCIQNNDEGSSVCSLLGINRKNIVDEFHYAGDITQVFIVAKLKWGSHVSYSLKIVTSKRKRPAYQILSFECQNNSVCRLMDSLKEHKATNNSLNLQEMLITTFNFYDFGKNTPPDFDKNRYSSFNLVSADTGIKIFIDIRPAGSDNNEFTALKSLMDDVKRCKESRCTTNQLQDVVLSHLGDGADQNVYSLGIIAGRKAQSAGFVELNNFLKLFQRWDECKIFASVMVDSINRGIIECKGNGLHNIIILPFDHEGFAESFISHPEDILLSSLGAMTFLNEVRLNRALPFHMNTYVSEKPGYRISSGTAEKIPIK